jgi:hypothetical protein
LENPEALEPVNQIAQQMGVMRDNAQNKARKRTGGRNKSRKKRN